MGFIKEKCILNNNISELHNIGFKNKTDKTWIQNDGYSYLVHYEKYMRINRKNINLLEIGVRDGASLKTWNEYFINSNIVGIDIDNNCNKLIEYNNIDIIIGDATKKEVLNNSKLNDDFDYIIDDGSHFANDIINSFVFLFNKLSDKGIYIIEDLDTVERISGKTDYDYMKKHLMENINSDVYSISYYPATLIIHKNIL